MRRIFGRRRRGRVQPQNTQGESKNSPRITVEEINARIRELQTNADMGFLSQDKLDEFIEKLRGGQITKDQFLRQTAEILNAIDTRIRQRRDRFSRDQQAEEDLERALEPQAEPQGASKTPSRYAIQPQVPDVPEESPRGEAKDIPVAVEVQQPGLGVEIPIATEVRQIVQRIAQQQYG